MDRLFGKQLSNLLDSMSNARQQRRSHRLSSKSSLVDEQARKGCRKFNRCSASQNHQMRLQKAQSKCQQMMSSKNEKKEAMKVSPKQIMKKPSQNQGKDVQIVPQYFDQCLSFMFQQQEKTYTLNNYIDQQTQINGRMRGILLDWLIDLHHKFKMFPQTIYLIAMIIDRYLARKNVTKENLQLVGSAALFIAAKYEETYQVPEVDDIVHYAARSFTKRDLIKMQAQMIQTLDFDLIMETSFRFFEPLAKILHMDAKNFHLAQYVLQLSLLETRFLEYKPSLVASSAIYLINKIRKRTEAWPDILIAATGYEEKQLRGCARELCQLLQKAEQLPNTKSLKKKFSSSQYHQVTRIKLERRKN